MLNFVSDIFIIKAILTIMKKLATLLFAALLAAGSASAQMLYKISGNGLEKPSYVIGTFHYGNVGFIDKIAGVREALTETDQMYGEVKWDDMMNADSVKYMQAKMSLTDGATLKTVLTQEQFAKVDSYVKKMLGLGLSNPQVFAQMGKLTPAALANQLQMLVYMQRHMGEFDPTHTFDQYFQAQAKKNNEPVGGLETMTFQTALLFDSTPMKRQVAQLMCLINNPDRYGDLMDRMANAYYAQDLDALQKVVEEKFGSDCDFTPEEEEALIYSRNAEWAKKMPVIMSAAPTFFAVGAGHLGGNRGLLQLLRTAGYTVERVAQ